MSIELKTQLLKMLFTCNVCENKFSTKFSLTRHLLKQHNTVSQGKNKSSKCITCQITFSTKKLLIDHLNTQHDMSFEKKFFNFSNTYYLNF